MPHRPLGDEIYSDKLSGSLTSSSAAMLHYAQECFGAPRSDGSQSQQDLLLSPIDMRDDVICPESSQEKILARCGERGGGI